MSLASCTVPRSCAACARALIALTSLLIAAPSRADLVLNEVLYDPDGADDGFEFVELWNPDAAPQSLDGVLVEACDGARPDAWVVVYRGAAADTVGPGGAFLIPGDRLVASIQNGPDAIRLTRAGAVLDLLGYGDLLSASLYEGAPAPDVASAESLARGVDGADTDVNRDDWEAEPAPTPGRANHPEFRLEISRSGSALSPEVGWPGQTAILGVRVRSSGAKPVEAARWRLDVDLAPGLASASAADSIAWVPTASVGGVALAPGESALVSCSLAEPAAGAFRLRARVSDLAPGPIAVADTIVVSARSLAGPVVVNEFAFRDAGAGEWIELWFRESMADLGAVSISDATGRAHAIDRGPTPRPVDAGDLVVVAEDPETVRARFALAESSVVGVVGGWPSLNDDGPDGAEADRVRVLDADGTPYDAVPYRSESSEKGGSVERLSPDLPSADAGSWVETIDPRGGTPGRPDSLRAPGGASARRGPLLVADERVLHRPPGGESSPVVLRVTSEAHGRRLTVRVHDLLGRPLRTLVDGQRFTAEGAFVWDGRDDTGEPVAPGLYVIRAEAMPEDGAPARATSVPLAVALERVR